MVQKVAYIVLISICAWGVAARPQDVRMGPQGIQQPRPAAPKLNDAERALVAASRRAIVSTGMSGSYFGRHFTLVKVVNQPGDRRIVWKFSVNGYETTVSDVLGYYTQNGKRVDTHSAGSTLRRTTEIEKTISKPEAYRIMRRCIGTFVNSSVEYIASGGEARLLLTAESIPKTVRRNEKQEREREARERASQSQNRQGTDVIEHEGENGPPIITGTVDLQTGVCTKGRLITSP